MSHRSPMGKGEGASPSPQGMKRDQRGLYKVKSWEPAGWAGSDMENLKHKRLWAAKERLVHVGKRVCEDYLRYSLGRSEKERLPDTSRVSKITSTLSLKMFHQYQGDYEQRTPRSKAFGEAM